MEQLLYELCVAAWCIPAGILVIFVTLAIAAHIEGYTFWEFVKPKPKAIEPKPKVQTITLNYFAPNEKETQEMMLRFTCGHTDEKLPSMDMVEDIERIWRETLDRPLCAAGCPYKSDFINHRDVIDDYFAFGTSYYPTNSFKGQYLAFIEEAAYEQGIDSMLEAYFAGVPAEDILA